MLVDITNGHLGYVVLLLCTFIILANTSRCRIRVQSLLLLLLVSIHVFCVVVVAE